MSANLKICLMCLLVGILLFCFPCLATAETEPNGNLLQANQIELNTSSVGSLSDKDDVDYYSFRITECGKLTLHFFAPTEGSSQESWNLTLIDGENTRFLGAKIDGGCGEYVSPSYGLIPGTYYVVIDTNNGETVNSTEYTVSLEYEVDSCWEQEPNNRVSSAKSMLPNIQYKGIIMGSADVDYFSFLYDGDDSSEIVFSHVPGDGTAKCWVLNFLRKDGVSSFRSSMKVALNRPEVSVSLAECELEEGETYYVTVSANGFLFHPSEYALSLNVTHECEVEYVEGVVSTCKTTGVIAHRRCQICGKNYDLQGREISDVSIPMKEHSWSEWQDIKVATCTEEGTQARRCFNCEQTESRNTVSKGHDYQTQWTVDAEATCQRDGEKSYHCTRCDSRDRITVIPKESVEHDFGEWVRTKAPTCAEYGTRCRVCRVCEGAETEDVPRLPHDFEKTITEDQALACDQDRICSRHCRNCLARTDITVQPAPGHDYEDDWTVDVEASCVRYGVRSRHCKRCDEKTDVQNVQKLAHDPGEWEVILAATCGLSGEERRTCKNCTWFERRYPTALGHDFDLQWTTDRAPTCTGEGLESRHCKRCSEHTGERSIPKTDHQAETWEIIKAPTCLEKGRAQGVCKQCRSAIYKTVDALGHNYQETWEVDVLPTCQSLGIESRHCQRCSSRTDEREIAMLAHSSDTQQYDQVQHWYECDCGEKLNPQNHTWRMLVIKAATCRQQGVAKYECVDCNYWYEAVLPRTEHRMGEWTELTSATCSQQGEKVRACAGCGDTETVLLDKLPHAYSNAWTVDLAPTCMLQGSQSHHCVHCGDRADVAAIPATGHSFSPWCETLAPTCTEKGKETRTCLSCNRIEERTGAKATGHSFSDWCETLAPTCTEKGKEARTCSSCNRIEERTGAKATGHSFSDWCETLAPTCTEKGKESRTCLLCNRVEERTGADATGHSFSAWIEISVPTCIEKGMEKRICSSCDSEESRFVGLATGHSFNVDFTVDVEATCEMAGSKSRHCRNCDERTDETELPPKGHSFGDWREVESPTCHAVGRETHTCSACQKIESRDGRDALGHAFESAWTVDAAPTCHSVGSRSRHCTRCDAVTHREPIAALDHTYDDGIVSVAPTCERTGSKIFTCTVCQNTYVMSLEKLPPVILGTAERKWKPQSEESMTFRSAASLVDFLEVRVNGEVVPTNCYLLREGSTIVELTPEYLDTLEGGVYTLEIVSTTGIASASFEVTTGKSLLWLWITLVSVAVATAGAVLIWILYVKKQEAIVLASVKVESRKPVQPRVVQPRPVQPRTVQQNVARPKPIQPMEMPKPSEAPKEGAQKTQE